MEKTTKYTTIIHKIRIDLDLSCNEYCVADTVYSLSNNPTGVGWCYASKKNIADFMGMTDRAVIKIIKKLIEKGIIDRKEDTGWLKTTQIWYDSVVLERLKMREVHRGEQSSEGVNKVPKREQSSEQRGELSSDNKDNSYNNSYNNKVSIVTSKTTKEKKPFKYEESFERFWTDYPEKTGKGKAHDSWVKLTTEEKEKCLQAILEQVKNKHFYKDWLKKDSVPHPTTWLNQRRWEDEVKQKKVEELIERPNVIEYK
mgnify:CR=1 FL=1